MTYIVYAAGIVQAELSNDNAAWAEAENLVAQGYCCAEVYVKLGEVQRTKVEYERVPANLDAWMKQETKEIK
jgi:hypothetical protein